MSPTSERVESPAPVQPTTPPAWSRAWRWIPVNLRLLLCLAAMLVGLFQLMRLGLILRTRTAADASWGELSAAFTHGLRFDLSTAAFALIPITVWCYLPWTSPWAGRRRRRAFAWLVTILLSVLSLILVAEFEFFHEFQARYNELAIRYLDHPQTVGGMAWYGFPVVRYLLVVLVIAVLVWFGVRASLRLAGGRVADAAAATEVTTPQPSKVSPFAAWRRELIGLAVIVPALVIGVRGGVQGEPLRWGDAFSGENEFVSQMTLNGLWCLGHTALDMSKRGEASAGWATALPPAEADRIARSLFVAPGERTFADDRTALRELASSATTVRLTTADGRPPNVVIVMMESFSARFCGATGAPRSFTPAFDALAADGRLFDRAFSAGTHTHQGIFATQLGFPNLPGYETLMESGTANQEYCSLSSIFQNRGYETYFLYNGDFAWDNMRGFFRKQGVETFIGGDDMAADAKYLDHVWGVSDGDLFDRCNREFEKASKSGRPFMAAVMTLSNHSPFEVPPVPGAAAIADMGELNGRLTAMRYADWAIGKFIADAKQLSYFNDTLFVFVGDHGFAVRPKLTEVNLLYHHVPLLFYAPGLVGGDKLPGVDHRVAAQMNIVPSVLGLLGITDAPYAAWARNLFNDDFKDENFAIFKLSGGGKAVGMARGDELLVLDDSKAEPKLMTYTLWPAVVKPETGPDAVARGRAMAKELRAYVQAAMDDLTDHEAGPIDAPTGGPVGVANQ